MAYSLRIYGTEPSASRALIRYFQDRLFYSTSNLDRDEGDKADLGVHDEICLFTGLVADGPHSQLHVGTNVGEVRQDPTADAAPMRSDTMFAIASMTKPMTATDVMILQDEGRLSVNDPVGKYIPAFKKASKLVECRYGTRAIGTAVGRIKP